MPSADQTETRCGTTFAGETTFAHGDSIFTVRTTGSGDFDVRLDANTRVLDIRGSADTDAKSTLTISHSGGGEVRFGRIELEADVGAIHLDGDVQHLRVGVDASLGELELKEGSGTVEACIFEGELLRPCAIRGNVVTLQLGGDLLAPLEISGDLGSLLVENAFAPLHASGEVHNVECTGDWEADLEAGRLVHLFSVEGEFDGTLTASRVVGTVTIVASGQSRSKTCRVPHELRYQGGRIDKWSKRRLPDEPAQEPTPTKAPVYESHPDLVLDADTPATVQLSADRELNSLELRKGFEHELRLPPNLSLQSLRVESGRLAVTGALHVAGKLEISGGHVRLGPKAVHASTLDVHGGTVELGGCTLEIENEAVIESGRLRGSGRICSDVTLGAGARLALIARGFQSGEYDTLEIDGQLSIRDGARMELELAGPRCEGTLPAVIRCAESQGTLEVDLLAGDSELFPILAVDVETFDFDVVLDREISPGDADGEDPLVLDPDTDEPVLFDDDGVEQPVMISESPDAPPMPLRLEDSLDDMLDSFEIGSSEAAPEESESESWLFASSFDNALAHDAGDPEPSPTQTAPQASPDADIFEINEEEGQMEVLPNSWEEESDEEDCELEDVLDVPTAEESRERVPFVLHADIRRPGFFERLWRGLANLLRGRTS